MPDPEQSSGSPEEMHLFLNAGLMSTGTESIISMDKVVESGQSVLRGCLGLEVPCLYFRAFGSAF